MTFQYYPEFRPENVEIPLSDKVARLQFLIGRDVPELSKVQAFTFSKGSSVGPKACIKVNNISPNLPRPKSANDLAEYLRLQPKFTHPEKQRRGVRDSHVSQHLRAP